MEIESPSRVCSEKFSCHLDCNDCGVVFTVCCQHIGYTQESQARRIFLSCDQDGDRRVSLQELRSMAQEAEGITRMDTEEEENIKLKVVSSMRNKMN